MKVFVTGACGQLGSDVVRELLLRRHEVLASDLFPEDQQIVTCRYFRLDLTDSAAVSRIFEENEINAVVHCAAWTAVDAAEELNNLKKVYAINAVATRNIAAACQRKGCKLIYISTDYVFNGKGTQPWQPDCEEFAPLNVYGRSKLEGEMAVKELVNKAFIIRISWVFGKNGKNFVKTMLRVGKSNSVVRVVNDQIGTPTYTSDLAKLLVDMLQTEAYGIYHATNEGGFISWYDFTKEIYHQAGLSTQVIPVTTEEYGLNKAERPFNSRMDKTKIEMNGFCRLPDWRDALHRYLAEIGELNE